MRVQLSVVRGRGVPEALSVQAASLDDARAQAVGLGYTVLSTRATDSVLSWWSTRSTRRADFDSPVFVEQLRDLLVAGLSVIEALDPERALEVAGNERLRPIAAEAKLRLRAAIDSLSAGH